MPSNASPRSPEPPQGAAIPGAGRLPGLDELLAAAHVVSLPMRVKFRGILHREALLLEGPLGWAEFCPFPEYGDAEASRWFASALEAGWQGFPEPLRASIPVNATVPAVSADRVPEILARFGRVDAVKVKVAERGQSLADDVSRVAAVREALPDAKIRVDANGGWDVPSAVDALTRLAVVGLEYAEQPVPEIAGLAEVRRRLRAAGTPLLIAADESVRKEEDPLKVARAGAADLIVVKVAPLGGVRRALEIVAQAGLPAVVSSALDTSVGIRAGLALAAALPDLPYACGLGTVSLLAADVTRDPLVPDDGAIRLREVAADPALLAEHAAAPERRDWWLDRLRRVHAEYIKSLEFTGSSSG
jgi:O-succinylbenzoate synthase